jgi:hypothetical protein
MNKLAQNKDSRKEEFINQFCPDWTLMDDTGVIRENKTFSNKDTKEHSKQDWTFAN